MFTWIASTWKTRARLIADQATLKRRLVEERKRHKREVADLERRHAAELDSVQMQLRTSIETLNAMGWEQTAKSAGFRSMVELHEEQDQNSGELSAILNGRRK